MNPLPLALHSPNPQLTIRPVRLSDSESLWSQCWPGRSFATVYNLVARAQQHAADGRGLGVVVLGDPEIRGYGQFIAWPTCAEISDLIVAAPHRGTGLGTAIIQTLVRAAYRLGAEAIEIGAAQSNPRATALYRRLGFEDSHTLLLNLGKGREPVLFLRLSLKGRKLE